MCRPTTHRTSRSEAQSSDFADLAAIRPPLDLRAYIDEQQLGQDYGPYLVSLSRVDCDGTWPSETGPIRGVFVGVNSKALVWTKEPEFTDLGYRRRPTGRPSWRSPTGPSPTGRHRSVWS